MKLWVCLFVLAHAYNEEYLLLDGHDRREDYFSPLPHTYIEDVPQSWDWRSVNGRSYLTKMLNQHIPNYCGSCWAHGSMSALGDRIKIARGGKGMDINLSVQFLLNCGKGIAGSCHGGSHSGAYQFIMDKGFVPFDTCLSYEACSSESTEGSCKSGNYECTPVNTCRTCDTYASKGGVSVHGNGYGCILILYFSLVGELFNFLTPLFPNTETLQELRI